MKTRIVVFVIVVLAALAGYVAGKRMGRARELQRSDLRFRVSFGLHLYHILEAGDTNWAVGDVRFVLWSDAVGYERAFGAPADSDPFARRFAEAKAITAQVQPELRTNALTFARELRALLATNNITIERK